MADSVRHTKQNVHFCISKESEVAACSCLHEWRTRKGLRAVATGLGATSLLERALLVPLLVQDFPHTNYLQGCWEESDLWPVVLVPVLVPEWLEAE